MDEQHAQPIAAHRQLVQQLLDGRIPAGKEFDECRSVLRSGLGDDASFNALFYLLRGALADPFFGIKDSQRVVPLIKALTRGEIKAEELM